MITKWDGFLLKRCHNLFEFVWNLDPCPVRNRNPCPVRNRNPEWARSDFSYPLCWSWIRLFNSSRSATRLCVLPMFLPESAGFGNLPFAYISACVSRLVRLQDAAIGLAKWRRRSNAKKNKKKKPSSQPVFPEPADPNVHLFLGGCSTVQLSWWVIKVNCTRRLMCEPYLSQDIWFFVNKENMWVHLKIQKVKSKSAGLSSSSSTFSSKMAHKMGQTTHFRDIPTVASKQKLPIAHAAKAPSGAGPACRWSNPSWETSAFLRSRKWRLVSNLGCPNSNKWCFTSFIPFIPILRQKIKSNYYMYQSKVSLTICNLSQYTIRRNWSLSQI